LRLPRPGKQNAVGFDSRPGLMMARTEPALFRHIVSG